MNLEMWPRVLDRMADIAGAAGGVLFAVGFAGPQRTASAALRDYMSRFVEEGWAANNSRSAAAFAKCRASFSTDHDGLEDAEIESSPLYQDFFRPRGFGWSIGTSIAPRTGDVLIVSLERHYLVDARRHQHWGRLLPVLNRALPGSHEHRCVFLTLG